MTNLTNTSTSTVAPPRIFPALAGFVLELFVFIPAAWFPAWMPTFPQTQWNVVVGHIVAALLSALAFSGWLSEETRKTDHLGMLALSTGVCFPLLGCGATLLVVMARRWGDRTDTGWLTEYRELVDTLRVHQPPVPDVMNQALEMTQQAMELRPFRDILAAAGQHGTMVSAIESMRQLERPVACRLLRYALGSGIAETRYYAARALGQMELALEEQLRKAEEAMQNAPGDPTAILAAADSRCEYGGLGGADDPVTRFHLSESVRLYQQCLPHLGDPDRQGCRERLASALLQLGRIDEARTYFNELVADGTRSPSVLTGAIESSYLAGDYTALARMIKVAIERCPESVVIQRIAVAWRLEPAEAS
jgi:tetratricopeptide (TPR) repeat protein